MQVLEHGQVTLGDSIACAPRDLVGVEIGAYLGPPSKPSDQLSMEIGSAAAGARRALRLFERRVGPEDLLEDREERLHRGVVSK